MNTTTFNADTVTIADMNDQTTYDTVMTWARTNQWDTTLQHDIRHGAAYREIEKTLPADYFNRLGHAPIAHHVPMDIVKSQSTQTAITSRVVDAIQEAAVRSLINPEVGTIEVGSIVQLVTEYLPGLTMDRLMDELAHEDIRKEGHVAWADSRWAASVIRREAAARVAVAVEAA